MEVIINYWAVLLATVAAIILGSVWYGPLFGKQWMHLVGIKKPETITPAIKKSMMKSYAITAITSFFMAFVLAHILFLIGAVTRVTGVEVGLQAGLWSWVGFVVPATMMSVLWEGRPWKYWFIVAGYYLVALAMIGVILAVWQ